MRVIVATDDLGNRVTKLPVQDGGDSAWFDFSSNRIEFDVEGGEIEVWNFVYLGHSSSGEDKSEWILPSAAAALKIAEPKTMVAKRVS